LILLRATNNPPSICGSSLTSGSGAVGWVTKVVGGKITGLIGCLSQYHVYPPSDNDHAVKTRVVKGIILMLEVSKSPMLHPHRLIPATPCTKAVAIPVGTPEFKAVA
jgi:hypothetical protein